MFIMWDAARQDLCPRRRGHRHPTPTGPGPQPGPCRTNPRRRHRHRRGRRRRGGHHPGHRRPGRRARRHAVPVLRRPRRRPRRCPVPGARGPRPARRRPQRDGPDRLGHGDPLRLRRVRFRGAPGLLPLPPRLCPAVVRRAAHPAGGGGRPGAGPAPGPGVARRHDRRRAHTPVHRAHHGRVGRGVRRPDLRVRLPPGARSRRDPFSGREAGRSPPTCSSSPANAVRRRRRPSGACRKVHSHETDRQRSTLTVSCRGRHVGPLAGRGGAAHPPGRAAHPEAPAR